MMREMPKAKGSQNQLRGTKDGTGATAIISGGLRENPPEISLAETNIDKNLGNRAHASGRSSPRGSLAWAVRLRG